VDNPAAPSADATLTPEQYLNVSTYLIRLGRYTEAIGLLTPAVNKYPDNFLLSSNLGTACYLAGEHIRALDYLQRTVNSWPEKFDDLDDEQRKFFLQIGWSEHPFEPYRRAEVYQFKLVKLRLKERKLKGLPDSVDALFAKGGEPVRFVGESGKYEPGTLAAAERAKLPPNALEIVEQLLVWFPEDARLYWLLAELLNARGDVKHAFDIMSEIRNNGGHYKDLIEHREALKTYLTEKANQGGDTPAVGGDPLGVTTNPQADTGDLFSWKTFAIGFATGAAVFVLGYWQLRALRRRQEVRRT
jgi:tetratricopeptide (TPR) repeat protein